MILSPGSIGAADSQLAQHLFDMSELLARRPVAGALGLGRFDLLPVAERDDFDSALVEQAVEPRPPRLAADRGSEIGLDEIGDGGAVRPVGADRSGRAAPRPADAIEAVADPALVIG